MNAGLTIAVVFIALLCGSVVVATAMSFGAFLRDYEDVDWDDDEHL